MHWGVTDVRSVLLEAFELVEKGLLDADRSQAFGVDNAIELRVGGHTGPSSGKCPVRRPTRWW